MAVQIQRMTVEEFDVFTDLPENADRLFEFIGGEVVEVPSNAYASEIGVNIAFFIKLHLRQNNLPGHVTGEHGGYKVSGERYAPDVAYVSAERQPVLDKQGYNSIAPDLAVEVDFPSSVKSKENLMVKVANYLAAGTVVWVVFPERKEVEVYAPGQPVRIFGVDDTLDGGNVLPGFKLPVKDVFPE
jgi:Uma2 family endonuclease